jgi:hypothetical protein
LEAVLENVGGSGERQALWNFLRVPFILEHGGAPGTCPPALDPVAVKEELVGLLNALGSAAEARSPLEVPAPTWNDETAPGHNPCGLSEPELDRRFTNTKRALQDSRLSAAMRTMMAPPFAPDSPATLRKLVDLQKAPFAAVQPAPLADRPDPIELTERSVKKSIKALKAGSAGLHGGWSASHVRRLLDDTPKRDFWVPALTALFNAILAGKFIHSHDLLTASTLVPVDRGNGKIRPIAVGEVIARLAFSFAMKSCVQRFRSFFHPLQYGVGSYGGSEPASLVPSIGSELCFNSIILKTDIRNAFGCISREAGLREVLEDFPDLYVPLLYSYGQASPLYTNLFKRRVVLLSEEGVRQGDPASSFLFAITLQRVIRSTKDRFPNCAVAAYLDDVSFIGRPDEARNAFEFFKDEVSKIGLSVQPEKCQLYTSWLETRDTAAEKFQGSEVKYSPDGLVVLGVPVGSKAFIRAWLDDKVEEIRDILRLLGIGVDTSRLSAHHAFLLLVFCVHSKFMHLPRIIPPDLLRDAAEKFDRLMLSAVCHLLRARTGTATMDDHDPSQILSPDQIAQIHLPLKAGGLGLRSAAAILHGAFVASHAVSGPLACETLRAFGAEDAHLHPDNFPGGEEARPHHVDHLMASIEVLIREKVLDPELHPHTWREFLLAPHSDRHGLQKCWRQRLESAAHDKLFNSLPEVARARLLSAASAGGAAPFARVPSDPSLFFSTDDFIIVLGLRLGIEREPFISARGCSRCMAASRSRVRTHAGAAARRASVATGISQNPLPVDMVSRVRAASAMNADVLIEKDGSHAFKCEHARGLRTHRHDAVVTVFLKAAKAAGLVVALEPQSWTVGDKVIRPDLAIPSLNLALDVVVSFPRLPTSRGAPGDRAGGANHKAFNRKLNHYRDWCNQTRMKLVPLPLEVYGRMHPATVETLRQFAGIAADSGYTDDSDSFLQLWLQRVSFALQKSNAYLVKQHAARVVSDASASRAAHAAQEHIDLSTPQRRASQLHRIGYAGRNRSVRQQRVSFPSQLSWDDGSDSASDLEASDCSFSDSASEFSSLSNSCPRRLGSGVASVGVGGSAGSMESRADTVRSVGDGIVRGASIVGGGAALVVASLVGGGGGVGEALAVASLVEGEGGEGEALVVGPEDVRVNDSLGLSVSSSEE